MRDFSLHMLRELLLTFVRRDYGLIRFEDYWNDRDDFDGRENIVLLRHDVDRFPETAFNIARLESEIGVYGTYFFRVKPQVFKENTITGIAKLGHEIGYHYEHLADAAGDYEAARDIFDRCLNQLRKLCPVVSVSMHSRAFSKWDSRTFWDEYSLDEFGLLGDTYRSIDHHRYMYLADSGRSWNADRNVVWDSVDGLSPPQMGKGTPGLIKELNEGHSIRSAQLLIHPNRWPKTALGHASQYAMDQIVNMGKTAIKTYTRLAGRR
ncbi:MAG: hypothetical protein JSW58_03280 [Candidatus Latescibacterota bacterium]|nr:MAG: hypothetical protein JSW58_03280 [Candidatus Latescibacterota bacterium]